MVALGVLRAQIDQHQMRVRATGDDVEALGVQRFRQRLCVVDDRARIEFEIRLQRFAKGNALCRNDMHQRAALQTGEYRRIDFLSEGSVLGKDHASARTAQRLVRRRGDDMRMFERIGMNTACDQSREVRHVHHEERADGICNLAKALEIDDARIGRAAGDDDLRLVLFRDGSDFIHVDEVVLPAHRVGHRLEPFARLVDRRAVREMSAGSEVQPHERVARLHKRKKDRLVRLRAGMRLDVSKFAIEKAFGTVDRQLFRDVHIFATAVVTTSRIPLRIFVRQDRALRLKHRFAHDVLGRNQLDFLALARQFFIHRPSDFRIGSRQTAREKTRIPRLSRARYRHHLTSLKVTHRDTAHLARLRTYRVVTRIPLPDIAPVRGDAAIDLVAGGTVTAWPLCTFL